MGTISEVLILVIQLILISISKATDDESPKKVDLNQITPFYITPKPASRSPSFSSDIELSSFDANKIILAKDRPGYYSRQQRASSKGKKWVKEGMYKNLEEATLAATIKRKENARIHSQKARDKRRALGIKEKSYHTSRKEKSLTFKELNNEHQSSAELEAAKTLTKMSETIPNQIALREEEKGLKEQSRPYRRKRYYKNQALGLKRSKIKRAMKSSSSASPKQESKDHTEK